VTSPGRPSGTARTLLLIAAGVVSVQGIAFAALTVLEVVSISSDRAGLGIVTGVFLALVAGGLLWAASRAAVGDAGVRSPLVFAQLIMLGLAWNFRGDELWSSAGIAVPALLVLGCLLASPVTRALHDDQPV
jgi:hypothetical protein